VKGRPIALCCACGAVKGTLDRNDGWWILASRTVPTRLRGVDGLHYCPACAPHLLVRSDEIQASPVPAGLRIFQVKDVYMMLAALRTAGMGFEPRETLGWEAAVRLAPLVGFTGLQPALPCREFGRFPEETP
jgi:hypothetical protein